MYHPFFKISSFSQEHESWKTLVLKKTKCDDSNLSASSECKENGFLWYDLSLSSCPNIVLATAALTFLKICVN